VIPQIIPLIFLTISLGHRLLDRDRAKEKKPPLFSGLWLFLWFLFPVSMGLKYLAKQFPQVFTGQKILNLTLLAVSAGLVLLYLVLFKAWPGKKMSAVPFSSKRILVFVTLAAILIFHGHRYLRWAAHPQFQFKQISQDLGKALPETTIAGLWAPVISLENRHRAHEYFPGAINDYPDFFDRFGITHVFTTTHAGEDKKFEQNFPDVMSEARLLARYHIWTVEALLYDIHPEAPLTGQKDYEAELFTQKGSTPRFDADASGTFAVLSQGKRQRFAVSIPHSNPMQEGTYSISFRMKKTGRSRNEEQRMARIDAVSEKRKKALAYKDVYPADLSDSDYQNIRMTLKVRSPEDVTFRVFTQGNGDIWVDRMNIQKLD
jgi:hypothetical protein